MVRKSRNDITYEVLKVRPKVREGENFRVWVFDKYVYVIDVSPKTFRGFLVVDGKPVGENLLTFNFYSILTAILLYARTYIRNISDGDRYVYIDSDPWRSVLNIQYGTGTTAEAFSDNRLVSAVGNYAFSVTLGQLSDRNRITCQTVLAGTSSELGIIQYVYTTAAYVEWFLYARKTGSFPVGSGIAWYIDLLEPWAHPFAIVLYGSFTDTNVSCIDIAGRSFTLVTAGTAGYGASYLVYTTSSVSWSPYVTTIPNPITMDTFNIYATTRYAVALALTGRTTPSSDVSVAGLGVVEPFRDTAGQVWTILNMLVVPPTPITFYGGKLNTVIVRMFAGG